MHRGAVHASPRTLPRVFQVPMAIQSRLHRGIYEPVYRLDCRSLNNAEKDVAECFKDPQDYPRADLGIQCGGVVTPWGKVIMLGFKAGL